MSHFTIYPAIDLRQGRVVRLTQGDWASSKSFELTPSKAAQQWISQGAQWLHVINLDGAFGKDTQKNLDALQSIIKVSAGRAKIQFGGGLRSIDSISETFDMGVSRVILGTAAVEDPSFLIEVLDKYGPEKIVLGMDARDGYVQVSGWVQDTRLRPIEIASRFIEHGLERVIFTNIRRDGMQQGVDIQATKALAEELQVEVIASGGVGTLEDIKMVKSAGLPGVVVGKALYENVFSLTEAIQC